MYLKALASGEAAVHMQEPNGIRAEYPEEDLDDQEDMSLEHQPGEDGARRVRRVAVRVGKPGAERIKRAFDGQARRHQDQGDGQRKSMASCRRHLRDGGAHVLHQQMSRQVVEQTDGDEDQTGADQAHHQIAQRGPDGYFINL